MQKRWVVILNKSPKGPLTETEVKTLIDQKFLRLNDLAFEVAADNSQATTDWKLLWQFPEFNRRALAPEAASPRPLQPAPAPEPEPGVAERRQDIPPEEQKRRALQALPDDLAAINPEDLVTHKRVQPMSLDEPLAESGPSGERRSFPVIPVAVVGGGLVAFALWISFGGSSTGERRTASESVPPRAIERPLQKQAPPPRPGAPAHFQRNPVVVRPPASPQVPAPAPPAAREGNPFQLNNPDRGNLDAGRVDYGDASVFDEEEDEESKVIEEPAFKDKARRRNRRGNAAADDSPPDGGNGDEEPTYDE